MRIRSIKYLIFIAVLIYSCKADEPYILDIPKSQNPDSSNTGYLFDLDPDNYKGVPLSDIYEVSVTQGDKKEKIVVFQNACPEYIPNYMDLTENDKFPLDIFKDRTINWANFSFDGTIKFTINSKKNLSFPIFLRIPEWANTASIKVNGLEMSDNKITANSFFKINRKWKNNDIIEIDFPFEFNTTKKLERVEAPQSQYNIFEVNWTAITRGPLVYSINGLINGTERETILNMDFDNLNTSLKEVKSSKFTNQTEYITPDSLILMPYYRADNREKTNWRLTWFLTDIK